MSLLIEPVARELLGEPNQHLSNARELRYGNHGSLSVDLDRNVWFDHEQDVGGGVLDLIERRTGIARRAEQMQWLEERAIVAPPAAQKPQIEKAYDYADEHGEVLFQVVRMMPKDFRQRRPDGRGGWTWSVKGLRQVPYRLPALLAAPDAVVYVVEGEKDVDRLASLGLVATCNAGGAKNWRAEHAQPLAGRTVVILPDNDDAGRKHAQMVLASLQGIADARIVELPGLPPKGDVSDWLDAGGTVEKLRALKPSEATPPTKPKPPELPPTGYPEPFRGPMAALHAQILLASPKPQPALATLACLIGMAGGVSGVYCLEDGMRCNLYGLGVSMSGTGKDSPMASARAIVAAAGGKLIGQPASGEGLEDALESRRGMACVLDEVAHIIAAMNHAKAPAHLLSLARNLLTLYSASRNFHTMRQRAAEKKGRPEQVQTILFPCLSLLGFATPEKLGDAATAGNVEDGLLGRMLFAFGEDSPKHVRTRHGFEIPPEVEAVAQQIGNAARTREAGAGNLEAYVNPEIVIRSTAEADAFLDELLALFDRRGAERKADLTRTLFVRSYEKVIRIAGVLAVWDAPAKPVIEHEHVAWALHLVSASNDAAQTFLREYMHGGEVQAHAAEILRALARLKERQRVTEVQHSDLLKAVCKTMAAKEFAVAMEHLAEMEDVCIREEQHGPRKMRWYS